MWFKNRRAKYRKKQVGGSGGGGASATASTCPTSAIQSKSNVNQQLDFMSASMSPSSVSSSSMSNNQKLYEEAQAKNRKCKPDEQQEECCSDSDNESISE